MAPHLGDHLVEAIGHAALGVDQRMRLLVVEPDAHPHQGIAADLDGDTGDLDPQDLADHDAVFHHHVAARSLQDGDLGQHRIRHRERDGRVGGSVEPAQLHPDGLPQLRPRREPRELQGQHVVR